MCKVAGITKVTDKNRDDVWIFMQVLGEYMTRGNNDGLGYAAFDKSGNIFGEKWLFNKTAFADLSQLFSSITAEKAAQMYAYFGDKVVKNEAQAIILHTRMATCAKNIQNTHPFVDNIDNPTVATIHNGVIYNDDFFEKKYSTCDSEVLVHLHKKFNVQEKLSNVGNFTLDLQGWYTVLNLVKTKDNEMFMDIYSDTGRLESYYIPELETRVYCTSASDIKATADFLGLTCKQYMKLKPNSMMRIDVLSGEIVDHGNLPEDETIQEIGGNIYHAYGSLDDEEFAQAWFAGLTGATNWRR